MERAVRVARMLSDVFPVLFCFSGVMRELERGDANVLEKKE